VENFVVFVTFDANTSQIKPTRFPKTNRNFHICRLASAAWTKTPHP